jgi:hypothetical protein
MRTVLKAHSKNFQKVPDFAAFIGKGEWKGTERVRTG